MAPRRQTLPPMDYMRAWLAESVRLYEEALPTATPIQKLMWNEVSHAIFVFNAWPYDVPNQYSAAVVKRAMALHTRDGWNQADALVEAIRVLPKPSHYVRR